MLMRGVSAVEGDVLERMDISHSANRLPGRIRRRETPRMRVMHRVIEKSFRVRFPPEMVNASVEEINDSVMRYTALSSSSSSSLLC